MFAFSNLEAGIDRVGVCVGEIVKILVTRKGFHLRKSNVPRRVYNGDLIVLRVKSHLSQSISS